MKKQNGFTLIELLLVLGLLSALLLLSPPFNITALEKHQNNRFLEQFQFDLLYIQNLASVSADDKRITINFDENSYSILALQGGGTETIGVRDYPEGWEVDIRAMSTVSFKSTGTIRQPGNIKMTSKNMTYNIVFPFGKGRAYIVEE